MKIQLKILNKKFYYEESNGMLLNPLPDYATPGSAALDLIVTEDVTIAPGEAKMIPTGLAIWIGGAKKKYLHGGFGISEEVYYTGLILPRSGLGTKGLILGNTIGLIDQDYQGELKVNAWNRNSLYSLISRKEDKPLYEINKPIELKAGNRFAQLMFIPVIKASFEIVEKFSNSTERGEGGFNSTGD